MTAPSVRDRDDRIVVGGDAGPTPAPSRWPGVLFGVAIVGGLAILGPGSEVGDPDDARGERMDVAALTSSTTTVVRTTRSTTPFEAGLAPFVEYSLADLVAGPRLNWTPIDLPDELTVAFQVGESLGQAAVIGSTQPPGAGGLVQGATLFRQSASGEWDGGVEVVGGDRFYWTGAISSHGFAVVSSSNVVPQLGATSTVHTSTDGDVWDEVPLDDPGSSILFHSVVVDQSATWVAGFRNDTIADVVRDALPVEVQEVLEDPFVRLRSNGIELEVVHTSGALLFHVTGEELGVDLSDPASRFGGPGLGVWRSEGGGSLEEVSAGGSRAVVSLLGGSSLGRGVYALAADVAGGGMRIMGSTGSDQWGLVSALVSLNAQQVHQLDDTFVVLDGITGSPSLSIVRDDERSVLRFSLGSNGEWTGTPEVGGAGYVLPIGGRTTIESPSFGVVERNGLTVSSPRAGELMVADGSGPIRSFSLWADTPDVEVDLANRSVTLIDGVAQLVTLTLEELLELRTPTFASQLSGGGGVLHTADGTTWRWDPLFDPTGVSGLAAAAAVGDNRLYVLIGDVVRWGNRLSALDPQLLAAVPPDTD